ncbi:MAG TPA: hypothetical protein VFM51_11170 [Solirubrobacterales bacterium]|nr:hypothetical protein [Solirubrobacterales bacterium]
MRAPQITRLALGLITASVLLVGITATSAPATFYDDFPFIANWVDLLPPYNEHLVTDVGGLYLGFAVLFAWATVTLERTLVRAVCLAWLLVALLHFAFHAAHLDGFGTADAVAELVSLALLVGTPVVALWGSTAVEAGAASPSSEGPRP